jgi:hypothetical protein
MPSTMPYCRIKQTLADKMEMEKPSVGTTLTQQRQNEGKPVKFADRNVGSAAALSE